MTDIYKRKQIYVENEVFMIDDRRIKSIEKAAKDLSYPEDIRKKLEMVVYQLKKDPCDIVYIDSIQVNTILNNIGILTSSDEKDSGDDIQMRFKIKKRNPIPSVHFNAMPTDPNACHYIAKISEKSYWIIGLRYADAEDPHEEEEDEEDLEEENEEDEGFEEFSPMVIVDKLINTEEYKGVDLDNILKVCSAKINGHNFTYKDFEVGMKGKKKFYSELAYCIFTGLPRAALTVSEEYNSPEDVFSGIADVITERDSEIFNLLEKISDI